jgi:hypothetical protein
MVGRGIPTYSSLNGWININRLLHRTKSETALLDCVSCFTHFLTLCVFVTEKALQFIFNDDYQGINWVIPTFLYIRVVNFDYAKTITRLILPTCG